MKKILFTTILSAFVGNIFAQDVEELIGSEDVIYEVPVVLTEYVDGDFGSVSIPKDAGYSVYASDKENDVCIVRRESESYSNRFYALAQYSTGKLLTPLIFSSLNINNERGVYVGSLNKLKGTMDKKGKIITPFIYSELNIFSLNSEYFFIAKKNNKYGMLDLKNQIIKPFEYDNLEFSYGILYAMANGKMQLIDFATGKVLLDNYEEIKKVNNDWIVRQNGLWNIVNIENKAQFAENYNDINQYGLYFIITKDGKRGVANNNYKVLLTPQYESLELKNGSQQIYAIAQQNGKYGLIDMQGNALIPFVHDKLSTMYYSDTLFTVEKAGLSGIISINNKEILPTKYTRIEKTGNYFLLSIGNLQGLSNLDGKEILPCQYEKVKQTSNNSSLMPMLFAATKTGQTTVFDTNGKEYLTPDYTILLSNHWNPVVYYPIICSNKKGKFGSIDINKKTVIPFEYDEIRPLSSSYAIVSKSGNYGIYNLRTNKIHIPLEYDFIVELQNKTLMGYNKKGFKQIEL